MKTKTPNSSLRENQSGIASMVIVILIMTLLTLVVLAMTKNSNREQRQALDRQLSSQAFYAAESGVNDAKDYISEPPVDSPTPPVQKTECSGVDGADAGNQFPGKDSQVGEFENTKYTCILYNRTPNELRYSPVHVKKSTIAPIEDAQGRIIKRLTFNWTQKDGTGDFSGCNDTGVNIPDQLPANCQAGLLRVELVDPSFTTRQGLINNTFLAYIKPSNSGDPNPTFTYPDPLSVSKQGAVTSGSCSDGKCNITINSIDKEKLYLNLRSMYKINQVFITGTTDTGPIKFRNAQMQVDSTGQAGDLLRRVQVMVDLSGLNSGFIPAFVLQTSSDLCKRLEVRRGGIINDGCS